MLTLGFYILVCKCKVETKAVFYFYASSSWVSRKKKIILSTNIPPPHMHISIYPRLYTHLYIHVYIHTCIYSLNYTSVRSNVDLFKPV